MAKTLQMVRQEQDSHKLVAELMQDQVTRQETTEL
tara:strand:+ start:171 stop:275 length:105 start_codon:yes stop_codon:yes gene_type:complete